MLLSFFFLADCVIFYIVIYMDESKKNRILLVVIIVLMLLVILIVGLLSHLNKKEKKEDRFKLKQIYVSDYNLVPYYDYFFGINENKLVSVIDKDGKELYLNDAGIEYNGFYMKDDTTPVIYNVLKDKLNVYTIGEKGPDKLFTINDVSNVIPLVYKNKSDEYLIGFIQYRDNDTFIYSFENEGLIVLDGITLIGDKIANNCIYTYSKDNIIVKKDDKYGSYDMSGKEILEIKYDDLLNDGKNIIYSLNDKYGIMDAKKEVIMEAKYKIIKNVTDGYLVGNEKLSFYDVELNKIINKKIVHNITDYSLREDSSLYEYKINSVYVIINNYLEDYLDKEYKYHNMYVINGNKITSINEIGFNNSNVIYSYDGSNITIYSPFLAKNMVISSNLKKIKDIRIIQKEMFYVVTNDTNIIFNKEGKKVKNTWGELLYANDDYLVYNKDGKVIFLDYDNGVLETITGNDIIVNDRRLIVDNNLYLIESW